MDIKPPISQPPIAPTNHETPQIESTSSNKSGQQEGNTTTAANTQSDAASSNAMKQAGTETKGTRKTSEHLIQQTLNDQLARKGTQMDGRSAQLMAWPESQKSSTPPLLGSHVTSAQTQNAPATTGGANVAQAANSKVDEARNHFEKGNEAFKAGKYNEALESFTKADQLYPHPDFKYNQAACLDMLGKRELAASKYEAYLAGKPDAPDAAKVQAHITKLRGEATKASQAAFDRGDAAFKAGKYKEAAGAFAEAYEHKPSPDLLYNMGAAHQMAGDTQNAVKHYTLYLNMHPDAKDAERVRANIQKLQKQSGTDLMHPDPTKASQDAFDRGQAAYNSGNFREAAAAFKQAYEHKPSPELQYNIGAAYHKAGDAKNAVKHYQQYLNDNPNAKDANQVRNMMHKLLEKTGNALIDPNLEAAQAAFDKGNDAYAAGRFQEAAAAFEEAYKEKPMPDFLYNIGAAYQRAGDTKNAVKNYQLYLNNHPNAKDADQVRNMMHKLLEKTGDGLIQP